MHHYKDPPFPSSAQLRLAIGDTAWSSIPDREEKKMRPVRLRGVERRPRIEHRQRVVLGGYVPARTAAGYTIAQIAVLYVIAVEHQRHGCCKLTVGKIAYLAQVCETIVHNTFRQALRHGDLQIKRRRVSRFYSLPNVITIVSRTWLAWLRLGPRRSRPWGGGGLSTEPPSIRVHGSAAAPGYKFKRLSEDGQCGLRPGGTTGACGEGR